MSDTSSMTPIMGILVFSGLCILVLAIWRYRSQKHEAVEQERAQAAVEAGIASGALTADGMHRACKICGGIATDYFPVSAASWMDNLPLLNRLFSLPPRYVIIDDMSRDLCLCRSHKQVAVKKLEEFHALLRAERARFNSGQADKVSQMDTGGLEQVVREQYRAAARALEQVAQTPVPQLQQPYEPPPVTIVMSPAGSDGEES